METYSEPLPWTALVELGDIAVAEGRPPYFCLERLLESGKINNVDELTGVEHVC